MKNALSKGWVDRFFSNTPGRFWKQRFMIHLLRYALITLMGLSTVSTTSCHNPESREQRVLWENLSQIRSNSFAGAECAWLITQKEGNLHYTVDGGRTWRTSAGKEVENRFDAVSFIDTKRGWAANRLGAVWETLDGGQSWRPVGRLQGNENKDLTSASVTQMQFIDELNGWAIGAFGIWRTSDSGRTWKKVLSILDSRIVGQPTNAFFRDSINVWVCATGGQVYRTTDGGVTWEITTLRDAGDLTGIFCASDQKVWVTGFDSSGKGSSFFTNDGGQSWQSTRIGDDASEIKSCYFSTESEGWAVGSTRSMSDKASVSRGVVLHTSDGAKKWSLVPVDDGEPFFTHIHFADPQNGWLIGQDKVYRTADGGKSWTEVLSLPPIKPIPPER